MTKAPLTITLAILAATLALAACGRGGDGKLASLDNRLVGNDADPAVTHAVNDPILTDRDLASQSNRNAIRSPAGPASAPYPPGSGGGGAGCAGVPFDENVGWARRLPPPFTVYPGAKVSEAAGSGAPCSLRFASFATSDPLPRVLDWYQAQAVGAGYSAERQARDGSEILAGTRGEAAYYLVATLKPTGTEVSLLVNGG